MNFEVRKDRIWTVAPMLFRSMIFKKIFENCFSVLQSSVFSETSGVKVHNTWSLKGPGLLPVHVTEQESEDRPPRSFSCFYHPSSLYTITLVECFIEPNTCFPKSYVVLAFFIEIDGPYNFLGNWK